MVFIQSPPTLGNQFNRDRVLRATLQRILPQEVFASIEPGLEEMGGLVGDSLYRFQQTDRLNEPVLTQWDPWGNRIDHIEVSPLWKEAERLAAKTGVVAAAFDPTHGPYARVHQFALAYLFAQSTDTYSCPLAMTDGAARTLLESGNRALIEHAVPHLLSRDPATFWTSGQWMTESVGGSDVSQSETTATVERDGSYTLRGRKWFTSATTSQMALTLARPVGNPEGSRGLALFFVELRDKNGQLNNIQVHRLKDKLGTRKVPTAELTLDGTPAQLVGEPHGGVRAITPMLNLTRTWNSVCAAALMRRGITLARDYSHKRRAFGALLADKPLHADTLAGLAAEYEAAMQLVFFVVTLIGKKEASALNEEEESLLRVLVPIMKLMTGKQAVAVASEVLECFGGAGYVEDTGLPALLREAQVLPIWEGTTNVLSLDTLRVIAKEPQTLGHVLRHAEGVAASISDPRLRIAALGAAKQLQTTTRWITEHALEAEGHARRVALSMGRAFALSLLCEHADHVLRQSGDELSKFAALRFATTASDWTLETFERAQAEQLIHDT